ncbi:uncharacterized protein LOC111005570 isoform X3 [Momordica charantia]|nr:uncharacterized protein LOC111005570 isoform X3 [Momordica charantia]
MLWIQYVNAYEILLLLTGYPVENLMKKFTYKICWDRKLFNSFKKHWITILDIEKKLPIESIAQARQISRYRAIKNVKCAEEKKEASSVVPLKLFYQIFSMLLCIWKMVCNIFCFIEGYMVKTLSQWQKIDGCSEIVPQDSNPRFCFMLNIGELLVSIYPTHEIQPPTIENLKSKFGIPSSCFLSFYFSLDALLFKYMDDLCEQSLLISCGQFNVTSLPSEEDSISRSCSSDLLGSLKEYDIERANNLKPIIWGESARSFLPSDDQETNIADFGKVGCNPFLVKYLGGMWLRWKSICMKVEESGIKYSDNPWFLCEINSSLTKSVVENSNTALWECNLSLGKLNLALGYSSILSASLLLKLMQHSAYSWIEDEQSPEVSLHAPKIIIDDGEVCSNNKCEGFASEMVVPLLKKLPHKHIQVAMQIAGSHIQMALEKNFNDGHVIPGDVVHKGDPPIAFDIHDIEIAVCPASSCDRAFLMELSSEAVNIEVECLRLKEPNISTIDNEKYASQGLISHWFYLQVNGLNAYVVDLEGKQQNPIFIFNPMLILSSIVRKYVHSFSENVSAFSVAFDCTTTGFTALSYMEDLHLFIQVIGHLSSAICYLGSASWGPQEFMKQNIMLAKPMPKFVYVKEASITCRTSYMILGVYKIKSMDVILHNSRVSDAFDSCKIFSNSQKMAETNLPDCGIWISIHEGRVKVTCEEEKVDILTDISEIVSFIFRYQKRGIDKSVSKYLLTQLLNCYHQIYLSNFMLILSLSPCNASSSERSRNIPHSSISRNNEFNVENFDMAVNSEGPGGQSVFAQALDFDSTSSSSNLQLLVNVSISRIFITSSPVHEVLVGVHQMSKLSSFLLVGGEFQTISWEIQGGILFLETMVLALFINCFNSYYRAIGSLLSVLQFSHQQDKKAQEMVEITRLEDTAADNVVGETTDSFLRVKWKLLEVFMLNVSNISLVLLIENESGAIWEFVIEVDAHLELKLADPRKTLVVNLSHLSIISKRIEKTLRFNIQIPHFSSNKSSHLVAGESASGSQYAKEVQPDNYASSSKHPVTNEDFSRNNNVSGPFCFSSQNYLLKNLVAFLSIEKTYSDHIGLLSEAWAGNGSMSGLDLTLSHSEIQMILLTVSSFSGRSDKEKTNELHKRPWSSNQGVDANTPETFSTDAETFVTDGAIIAIRDIHQHMYLSVEGGGDRYNLVGAMHYSLVGDRALFRVKYKKQRRWPSPVLWFSLISLYAKNAEGKHLRLNCCPGSGVVNISGIDDRGTALWRSFSHMQGGQKGDTDWEPYNQFGKRTLYLVNKKSDCGIAFVDGVPEFVRKPGNPFKFKMIHDFPGVCGVANMDHYLSETSETSRQQNSHMDVRISGTDGMFPSIDISIENISLTIVHEISDTNDILPLIRGSLGNMQLTLQISSNKTRILSTSNAVLHYFDVQRNLWQRFINPVDFCLYYRLSVKSDSTETISHRVPVHIYCRMKELDISFNETSLDVVLFVIGKLDLAGPYAVRSSIISPNCCKVENQLGIDLLCHFHNKQSLTIRRFQSAFISLRHPGSPDQTLASGSVISIQLSETENFTTPINISQLQPQTFTQRTRIISAKDSRTYPGPLIVVEISRHPEDGLSIVVSPMTRIHNESGLTMELRFRRNQPKEDECASVLVEPKDVIDDSMGMFDALNSSGGLRKALMSLSVGNFLLSFRPKLTDNSMNSKSVEWSDDFKGEKAVHLSGIFDKLSYKVRKALMVGSEKYSFSTSSCKLLVDGGHVNNLHFLIQCVGRDVHILQPDESGNRFDNSHSSDVLQEQKQIFLLPTVRVSNLLYSEIHVLLSETDTSTINEDSHIGTRATISSDSTADFYVNPAIIFFTVTLTALNSTCKSVSSGDFVKKLLKQKSSVQSVDIDLDFGGGKYFASLRLARGHRGTLEVSVFAPYALKNDTNFMLRFLASNKKTLYRDVEENGLFPNLGICLAPNSTCSWLLKSKKVFVQVLENYTSEEALLDLDALSGFTELSLQMQGDDMVFSIKLGVSLGSPLGNMVLPSQLVTIVPRYVVINESKEDIIVRQCYLQNDGGTIEVNSKQKATLKLQDGIQQPRESSVFENFVKKHTKSMDDSLKFIQFCLSESDLSWSGPICVASLGRFYLKFKRQPDQGTSKGTSIIEFAAVHVVEEGSTLSLHFHKPPNTNLPYRIENCLHNFSVTYYQKDVLEPEVLGSQCSVDYVWDDLTLPHELVVLINESLVREINLDKLRAWKPLYKSRQQGGLARHFLWERNVGDRKTISDDFHGREIVRVGYEIYADGPTRVLRICEKADCHKGDSVIQTSEKIQLIISDITVHLLECWRQDENGSEPLAYMPLVAARLGDIKLYSVFTEQQKYNQITIQSLRLEEKRVGAVFAAMVRRHQVDYSDSNDCVLKVVCILNSTSIHVKQVKYLSVVLQPIDLNLDEETLMRIAPFWRTSLSDSKTRSQQYYFDHFEIHPIKIIANFLPEESYSSYSSTQETLRTLLHSVVKIPPMKNVAVELNGVLVTHALITMRELFLRCAQHYSWYAMRAVYIAKGSSLLPPDFISIFDDLSSSSLDVFFDPSRGFMGLPGTFKFIKKCIDVKRVSGTKRYFGDLGKTLKTAGSNVIFAAITEISDSVLKGAEASGFNGMVSGFHQGILKIAMDPSLLGSVLMEGGPDRKIKLDRSPGVDELYVEGYLQAMLDTMYKQEYLRVRVIDNQVILKNLPPNTSLINEIVEHVKRFLVSKALLKGDPATATRPFHHLRRESEWKIGPTVRTLCEHLFVSFAIRMLRKGVSQIVVRIPQNKESNSDIETTELALVPGKEQSGKFIWSMGIGKFMLSGILAYIDGRLCRNIPHPIIRRIVSGFLLTLLDNNKNE